MNKFFTTAALVFAFSAGTANANPSFDPKVLQAAQEAMTAITLADLQANVMNLINWKVGDYHKMKIEFLMGGEGRKEATKEDTARNAIWLKQEMTLLGQKQTTEALISRADGKVLELIVNGQKQDPNKGGDSEIEIIEQSETQVTVPAGTFECIYIKANITSEGQKMLVQMWANPYEVNLDGSLKLVAETQFGNLTILLTEYGPKK